METFKYMVLLATSHAPLLAEETVNGLWYTLHTIQLYMNARIVILTNWSCITPRPNSSIIDGTNLYKEAIRSTQLSILEEHYVLVFYSRCVS